MVLAYHHPQPSVGVTIKSEPSSPITPFPTGVSSPTGPGKTYYNFIDTQRNDGTMSHNSFVSMPKYHSILHLDPLHHPSPMKTLRTPSLTPSSREDDLQSRMSRMSMGHDPIVDSLNKLRADEKGPLGPIDAFLRQESRSLVNPAWSSFQVGHDKSKRELLSAQATKRRSEKRQKGAHCNIKYTMEELDYIRYHRVDLGESWKQLEEHFALMFPMDKFPDGRVAGGLQGAYYRQHKALPLITNGELQFMENGHVVPVWVFTRDQSRNGVKHLYGLVQLYPERAMKYPWLPADYRHMAHKLSKSSMFYLPVPSPPFLFLS